MSVQQKIDPVTEMTSRVTEEQEIEITYDGSIRMWYWRSWCNADKTGNWACFLDDVVMRNTKTQENEAI
jgi:hypothetical protein